MLSAPVVLAPGLRFERAGPSLTQEAFTDFGHLLGTDAPIHLDPAYARGTAFGGTIAQGMLLAAPVEAWLRELVGEAAWFRRGKLEVRLLATVQAGEPVTIRLHVLAHDAALTRIAFEIASGERLLAAGTAGLG